MFKLFINFKFVIMCFTKVTLNPPKTAETDILGIKVLRKSPTGRFLSPFRGRTTWGMKRKVLLNWEKQRSGYKVYVGLHCFKNIEAAKKGFDRTYDQKGLKYFLVIIPKGARYYENASQYCSDQMELVNMTPLKITKNDKRKAKK